jgi:hypothetical protein
LRYGVKCPIGKDSELLLDLAESRLDVKVLDCSFFIYLYGVVEAMDEKAAKAKFTAMAEGIGAHPLSPIDGRFDWVIFHVDETEPEGVRGASDLDIAKLE